MRLTAWCVAALALAPGLASALDYRSVAVAAPLFDTPSKQGKKEWVILKDTPVEVIVSLDQWVKVRDAAGTIAWMERKALSARRTVIVTGDNVPVRQQADVASPLAFTAARDLVLEMLDKSATGWIKVKHRDGTQGFVRATDVWGE